VYPLTTQESNDQQMLLIHKFKWIVVRTCTSCSQWLCMQMPGSPHNALYSTNYGIFFHYLNIKTKCAFNWSKLGMQTFSSCSAWYRAVQLWPSELISSLCVHSLGTLLSFHWPPLLDHLLQLSLEAQLSGKAHRDSDYTVMVAIMHGHWCVKIVHGG